MMVSPYSSEDFLAHYGVKGMKWGVIRDKTKSGLSKTADVVSAKGRLQLKDRQTVKNDKAIYSARNRMSRSRDTYRKKYKEYAKFKGTPAQKARLAANLRQREQAYMNDPARVTAKRVTAGEAVIQLMFATRGGPTSLALASTRLIGNEVLRSRAEYTQRNGGYKLSTGKVKKRLGERSERNLGLVVAGAAAMPTIVKTVGQVNVKLLVQAGNSYIGTRAFNNRQAAQAAAKAAVKAIGSKAAKVNYAKKGVRGAYKITTMK